MAHPDTALLQDILQELRQLRADQRAQASAAQQSAAETNRLLAKCVALFPCQFDDGCPVVVSGVSPQ